MFSTLKEREIVMGEEGVIFRTSQLTAEEAELSPHHNTLFGDGKIPTKKVNNWLNLNADS